MTARAETVGVEPKVVERLEKAERKADREEAALPPGADGTRKAIEEHAARWTQEFRSIAERHEAAAVKAREQEDWWRKIAAAASPLRLVPDQAEEVVG